MATHGLWQIDHLDFNVEQYGIDMRETLNNYSIHSFGIVGNITMTLYNVARLFAFNNDNAINKLIKSLHFANNEVLYDIL